MRAQRSWQPLASRRRAGEPIADFIAAICAVLVLYGGWLSLRYSEGREPYRNRRKPFRGTMPARKARRSRAEARVEEALNC